MVEAYQDGGRRKRDSKAEARRRYIDPEGLLDLFREGHIRLLRGSWLARRAGYSFHRRYYSRSKREWVGYDELSKSERWGCNKNEDGRCFIESDAADPQLLPYRQQLEAEDPSAYLPFRELAKMVKGKAGVEWKPLPVVAVSYCWERSQHPDPAGRLLQSVAKGLKDLIEHSTYTHALYYFKEYPDFGVFLDWASVFQKPRSPEQDQSFKHALSGMNLVYAHSRTVPLIVTDQDNFLEVPRSSRGWPRFEEAMSFMLKDKSQVVGGDQAAPLASEEFESILEKLTFTNGADRQMVARLYKSGLKEALSAKKDLKFEGTSDNLAALGRCLQEVAPPLLETVFIKRCGEGTSTPGEDDLFTWLAGCSNIRQLRASGLEHVTESIMQIASMTELHLSASWFQELPGTIGNLQSLRSLYLDECTNLKELPAAIGGLSSLKALLLWQCYRLTELPDAIGSLSKLEGLWLEDCKSLRQLPETICGLPALQRLSLRDCWLLEEMPSAVADMKSLRYLDLTNCPASFRFKTPARARCTFGGLLAGRLVVKRDMYQEGLVFLVYANGDLRPREQREASVKFYLDKKVKKGQQEDEAPAAAAAASQAKEDQQAEEAPAAADAVVQAKERQHAEEARAVAVDVAVEEF